MQLVPLHLAPFVSTYLQQEVMSGLVGKQKTTMMGETKGGTKWDMLAGAVLVADISGFTPLTERLTKKGPGGIELLTKCINSYFDLIIGTVKAHGGDVIKFAGDAVICLFKRDGPEYGSPEERLDSAVQAAVWAGLARVTALFCSQNTLN
jgi:class 3 adenylate cyclase